MSEQRLWTFAGVIFLLVAALNFVKGNGGSGAAFVAIGVVFLTMPRYQERKNTPEE